MYYRILKIFLDKLLVLTQKMVKPSFNCQTYVEQSVLGLVFELHQHRLSQSEFEYVAGEVL